MKNNTGDAIDKPTNPILAFKKKLIIVLVAVLMVGSFSYWLYDRRFVSTDDAYINANVVQIASRVSGQVAHINTFNHQYVKQGQVLFALDTQPFEIALDKAQAELAINEAQRLGAQLTVNRNLELIKKHAMSPQTVDDSITKLDTWTGGVQMANTLVSQAKLDLQHTKILAPVSGWIANMSLRAGNMVEANRPLFALISDEEFWIDANFKETQMAHIRQGQRVDIVIDMYPDKKFSGVVESISPNSGNAFSLLPPQNATGNWVKVTQRVPVRVRVLTVDPHYPLRVGATASVKIYVRS
ncbi:MAG TPA: HlyD family secretion protein [Gammaproteobacteria bacterium]|nr:HlyD family secretion protein [Gammaproteobacteria bacterium]